MTIAEAHHPILPTIYIVPSATEQLQLLPTCRVYMYECHSYRNTRAVALWLI